MSKLTKEITHLNKMLDSVGTDLGIHDFNPTEFSIFFDIIQEIEEKGKCSMLKAVEVSGKSRSTVYKTIRKLVKKNVLLIESSIEDKRSFLLKPQI
jgi:DNA-binding MarR family transcriptional regulator